MVAQEVLAPFHDVSADMSVAGGRSMIPLAIEQISKFVGVREMEEIAKPRVELFETSEIELMLSRK